FLGALADDEPLSRQAPVNRGQMREPALRTIGARWPALRTLGASSPLGRAIAVIGAIFGLYIAGYTGVLLAVTNRPIWSDTPLIGMLFMMSAASTSAALILLLAHRSGWTLPGLADVHRMEDWAIVLELLVLVAVVVSLGPVLRAWLNVWGLLLAIVILLGMIAPLALSWRARQVREFNRVTPAVLVLVAGLLLRVVIVFSSEAV
ncbi:MAG TPA: NrfD/PsrC family molybdoenzyme membrane anchor subunit, partial [Vicinamibacterales bacterium]|nr:NrfD/PsrC family molybdoenzyme membrane anchor subunit [Vicinamibacterales bacterium]